MVPATAPGALIAAFLAPAALLGPALAATPTQAATTAAVVPSETILIDTVTVNGPACKKDTVAVAIAPDNTAFTVTYSEYLAMAGGSAVPADAHKKCKINVTIHTPQGYTYAVDQTDYRGYASLATGVSAVQSARYQFQGDSEKPTREHTFTGPYDDYWQTTDVTDVADLVWAPCGKSRKLNIDTDLTISLGSSDSSIMSMIVMDSADGALTTTYHFAWKQCS